MMDAEMPPEASIEGWFRIVHDHLGLVDRTLDELAGELETELEAVLEDTSIDVKYDIDTGSFQADLSIEHVVAFGCSKMSPLYACNWLLSYSSASISAISLA